MGTKQEAEDILRNAIYRAGRDLFKKAAYWFLFGGIVTLVLQFSTGYFDKDSTDGETRSNMRLHTDALTGCQYLSGIRGGITPRVNADGSHYGCKG